MRKFLIFLNRNNGYTHRICFCLLHSITSPRVNQHTQQNGISINVWNTSNSLLKQIMYRTFLGFWQTTRHVSASNNFICSHNSKSKCTRAVSFWEIIIFRMKNGQILKHMDFYYVVELEPFYLLATYGKQVEVLCLNKFLDFFLI